MIMIRIDRSLVINPPQELVNNQQTWTNILLNLVHRYGSYGAIPKSQKDRIINNYNLQSVKDALKTMCHSKCAYCESKVDHIDYPHIEHYSPKSLYPNDAFNWDNFLLSCAQCNINKGNFDVCTEPFIDPCNEDPEEHIAYNMLRIIPNPSSSNIDKGRNVINECGLKRTTLIGFRADILKALEEYVSELEPVIDEYITLRRNDAKERRAIKIKNSLDRIKAICQASKAYASFARYFCKNNQEINNAINIVNQHRTVLGFGNARFHLF